MSDQITHLIYNFQPDEVYHLGAQSHVMGILANNLYPAGLIDQKLATQGNVI
jgi:GDP-D-mannose dehydratase